MRFLDDLPRYVFFTGKGGVGKTSIACATAVQLADAGARVLLVSTDPASNVGQVFGLPIGNRVTAIPDVPRLSALEIDPEAAAQGYRDRIVGPVRGVAARRRREGHRGAALWRLHDRDCRLRRVHRPADRHRHRHRRTTTSSSIRRRPGTPSASCSCLARGAGSWTPGRATPPASGRSPGSTSSARSTRRAVDALADTQPDPHGARGTGTALVARRGRSHARGTDRDRHHRPPPGGERTCFPRRPSRATRSPPASSLASRPPCRRCPTCCAPCRGTTSR